MQVAYDSLKRSIVELRMVAAECQHSEGGREAALAITNAQQSLMWLVEAAAERGDFIAP